MLLFALIVEFFSSHAFITSQLLCRLPLHPEGAGADEEAARQHFYLASRLQSSSASQRLSVFDRERNSCWIKDDECTALFETTRRHPF